jgi:hypothetical protein
MDTKSHTDIISPNLAQLLVLKLLAKWKLSSTLHLPPILAPLNNEQPLPMRQN